MTLSKKEFSQKPIQLLFYVPDRIFNSNDRIYYIALYKYLADRKEYFFVDNAFALDQALLEGRTSIYALIREKCDIDKYAYLSQLIFASDSVHSEICLAKHAAILRYDFNKLPWISDTNCLKLPINKVDAVIPEGAVNLTFHYIQNEMLIYNAYINGVETTRL